MVEQFDAVFGGTVVEVQGHDDAAAGLRVIGLQLAQPLGVIAAMAQVRAAVDVLIEADEAAYTPHDVVQIIRAEAAGRRRS